MSALSFSPSKPRRVISCPVMPLRDVVIFPHAIVPLLVGRESSIRAVESAFTAKGPRLIFMVTQKDSSQEEIHGSDGLFTMGCVCQVLQLLHLPDGNVKAVVEGLYRATFSDYALDGDYPSVVVTPAEDVMGDQQSFTAAANLLSSELQTYIKSGRGALNQDASQPLESIRDASALCDSVMARVNVPFPRKQEILEILDVAKRMEEVFVCLHGENSLATIEQRIKTRVREAMEKSQRDYYLNEQLKAINKELGREEDPMRELDRILEELKKRDMPQKVKDKVESEIRKLRIMTPQAAEYTIVRGYVDWIMDLPWNSLKDVDIDIEKARRILDANHYGLEKPKERILEYLAVQKLSGGLHGPILCLVGPPGVGKTSLAKSVALATGRDYLRLSLGGVRDEAEIRGHRRTYIGALPGKIIQSLKRVKYNNPLLCLDEVDKMTSDYRGDPAAALLEVLDPEQNNAFMDHYLDLDYDLSKVFFITTANSLEDIPAPLLDRMEIIELHSYLETEKYHIAKNFLIPRQIKENGLKDSNIKFTDNAIISIIRDYTGEAGVRNLERRIAKICRKVAVKLLESKHLDKRIIITCQTLPTYLGQQIYRHDKPETTSTVGVCNGLAWTSSGGELLLVETSIMPGTGQVVTTGKLGEVMQESAKAALSYVRAHSELLGLSDDFHKKIDIHVHVPDGATPKDGPSAGITIATAITSALLGIPVRNDIAMTGEISLRGRVLPIGGLREKLLGAKRAGVYTVIVPKDNERDIKEVPAEVVKGMNIIYVEHVTDVLPLALNATKDQIFSGRGMKPLTEKLRAGFAEKPAAQAQ